MSFSVSPWLVQLSRVQKSVDSSSDGLGSFLVAANFLSLSYSGGCLVHTSELSSIGLASVDFISSYVYLPNVLLPWGKSAPSGDSVGGSPGLAMGMRSMTPTVMGSFRAPNGTLQGWTYERSNSPWAGIFSSAFVVGDLLSSGQGLVRVKLFGLYPSSVFGFPSVLPGTSAHTTVMGSHSGDSLSVSAARSSLIAFAVHIFASEPAFTGASAGEGTGVGRAGILFDVVFRWWWAPGSTSGLCLSMSLLISGCSPCVLTCG